MSVTQKLDHDVVINYPSYGDITFKSIYSLHSHWCRDAEKQTKKWWAENIQEDWNILDIGSHVGMYAALFCQKAPHGKIFCFEPTDTRHLLETNMASLGVKNCTIYPYAVGNKNGHSQDFIHMVWQHIKLEQGFHFITVDEFVTTHKIDTIHAIKIDTDGYDPEVLFGSEKTLKQHDISVIVELNPGALAMRNHTPQGAVDYMKSIGYELKQILDGENYLFQKHK